ncbi:Tyrosinase [Colletotrichum sp. SAR11_57]|nr:Tyrosinase [Colletotrichum sp. SAR11_57]
MIVMLATQESGLLNIVAHAERRDLLPVFTGSRTWLGLGAGRRKEQTQGIVRTIKCYSAPGIVRIFHCMSKSLYSMLNDLPPPIQPHQEGMTALPTVVINRSDNGTLRQSTVRNPFFRYTYPASALQGDFGKFDGNNYTKRCVDDGQSFPESANDILSGFNLKEKVRPALTKWSRRNLREPTLKALMVRYTLEQPVAKTSYTCRPQPLTPYSGFTTPM